VVGGEPVEEGRELAKEGLAGVRTEREIFSVGDAGDGHHQN
jgi:hypothetical protein